MTKSVWEALPEGLESLSEGRVWSGGPPERSGGPFEISRIPPGGPGGVSRSSWRAMSDREAFLQGRQWSERPTEGPEGVGRPSCIAGSG